MTTRIIQGDCLNVLKTLPDESVHCIVTSPPYWGQRDYGTAMWTGGDSSCDHSVKKGGTGLASAKQLTSSGTQTYYHREICPCGAIRTDRQIGNEATPEAYTNSIVAVFTEARRVLRSDGTCWVNLGDKWASGGNGNCKDKDLIGVPWMVAFAMRADGWYLRQCNIWAKPNGMPESVRDGSTVSHEYVFQFSKNNDYWYNTEGARTPAQPSTETRLAQDVDGQLGSQRANGGAKTNGTMKAVGRKMDATSRRDGSRWNENGGRGFKQRGHGRRHVGFNERWDAMPMAEQRENGANLRSVWWIAPAQYREGHFAVMPAALAEICIACGCPEDGTVLDPFGGAGTTGLVADRMQRDAILIELNPEYAAMAERRISDDAGMFAQVESSQTNSGTQHGDR